MSENVKARELLERKAKKLGTKQLALIMSEDLYNRLKKAQLAEFNNLDQVVSLHKIIISGIEDKIEKINREVV